MKKYLGFNNVNIYIENRGVVKSSIQFKDGVFTSFEENENLENYSSLSQGLSSLDNFKLMPINVKEKIINIMSKKRKRNNN